jgi:NAD(P)-dependent dehydrogenase (short-subunit alcohol dehydrogenase family)
VLSSGIHMQGTIEELPESAFADLLGPNVIGPAALARSLAAALRESAGHIVIINSTVIRAANIGGRCYYAAGEHAMKAVADGLRDELNAAGISVTSVYPGVTATARQEMLFREAGRDYPAERILQPADVAAAVVASLSMRATAEITDLYIRPKNRI